MSRAASERCPVSTGPTDSSTSVTLLPNKNPKTIRKYLSILLRSTDTKQEEAVVKTTKERPTRVRVATQRMFTVPVEASPYTRLANRSLPSTAATTANATAAAMARLVEYQARHSATEMSGRRKKQVQILIKPKVKTEPNCSGSNKENTDKALVKRDAAGAAETAIAAPEGNCRRQEAGNEFGSLPTMASIQTSSHSAGLDIKRSGQPRYRPAADSKTPIDPRCKDQTQEGGRGKGREDQKALVAAGSHSAPTTTSTTGAPPRAYTARMVEMPLGLSPEDAQHYIRLLIRARLQDER